MPSDELVDEAAGALLDGVTVLSRRLRQRPVVGELSEPEAATLSRLTREAPTTAADLARAEDIRPQSMGAVVSALEARGLVRRHRDKSDGRRVLLTATVAGRQQAERRRTARGDQLVRALSEGFSEEELRQLLTAAALLGRIAGRIEQPVASELS